MNTKRAFEQAASRVQEFLGDSGIRITPATAMQVIEAYKGRSYWLLPDFKKAATGLERHLAHAGFEVPHTLGLELVSRIEGLKSWNVLLRNIGPDTTDASEDRRSVLLAQVFNEARRNQSSVAGVAASVRATLAEMESEIGSSAKCVNVEFDPEFAGGDYSSVGDFVAVPLALIELAQGSVETAFIAMTGLPSHCMIHYTLDEVVNQVGEPFYEPEDRAPLDPEAAKPPLMWICKDRPLTEAELNSHTNGGEDYIKVVVDVSWNFLGMIDELNDEVSERITGSICDLQGLGYANFFPTDRERAELGQPADDTVWIEVHAMWVPCD